MSIFYARDVIKPSPEFEAWKSRRKEWIENHNGQRNIPYKQWREEQLKGESK